MSSRIIDIRLNDKTSNGEADLREEIAKGLSRPLNQKSLPTVLQYDDEGLRTYDEITTDADEYSAEEKILKCHAHDIVQVMYNQRPVESVVLELGAGALRKTSHLLSELSKMVPEQTDPAPISYYALDIERRELERTLDDALPTGPEMQGKVDIRGLWGTFEGGLRFAAEGGLRGREAAVAVAAALRSRSLSSDGATTQPSSPSSSKQDSIETAPSTPDAATLELPLHIVYLGFSLGNFPRGKDVEFLKALPLRAGKGDTLLIGLDHCTGEVAHKYTEAAAHRLFTEVNLRPLRCWTDAHSSFSLWLLERPPFNFRLLRTPASTLSNTPFGVPTLEEFRELRAAWNFITRKMIPDWMLFEKPIDLRHICLFYTGHIPTFLDIHLSNLLDEPNTEPKCFKDIFERGIDPNVDDPTQCHPHSEVPEKEEDWPSHATILDFQKRVDARLENLYAELESGSRPLTRRVARVLFMALEHEAWHTETILFMLIQRAGTGTIPPSVGGFATPCWESLAKAWDARPAPVSATVTLGPATLELGHDDFEADDASLDVRDHEFGWDNEHPRRKVDVGEFHVEWRPVTNGQFYEFWKASEGKIPIPKLWVMDNGNVMVRTLFGPVPMKIARLWPVIADYNSLSQYATVHGGRLPTEFELRLFYDKFEISYEEGRNVGFRNWHPVPATTGGQGNERGHNGGVWEWTSTVWDKYDGFEASSLYPGFSADFFDTYHNVVLGASYAQTPRIADRRTVRCWFQRNYPYAWVGARVVYDVEK